MMGYLVNFGTHFNFTHVTLSLIAITILLKKDNEVRGTILVYCCIPLLTPILSYVHFIVQRHRKLSILYDMDGNHVTCNKSLPPFVPEKDHPNFQKIHDELESKSKSSKPKENKINAPSSGWAMVTGASRGIGRALCIELARYNFSVILVARDEAKLKDLAVILEDCYGVKTKIFVSDFSKSDAAEELIQKISKKELFVDILIHNAGIGDTKELVHMDSSKIQDIITVNTITGSKLCQMLGLQMKERRRGRIVLISSIAGAVPGRFISSLTKIYSFVP